MKNLSLVQGRDFFNRPFTKRSNNYLEVADKRAMVLARFTA